ncbi:hypothetical protein ACJA23_02020 [Mycoplasma corogypsi]|uniref:hypothetical protein n=1 Tax=Mycoplasma corogypsi TaxID=2106 RepID=UPI0038730319
MEYNQQTSKIDWIDFRKKEIEHAILKAQSEDVNKAYRLSQKNLPWYKRELFYNSLGAITSLFVLVLLVLIAYFVATYA